MIGVTPPILVDGCCGAGGAAKGYQRAGFYVVGIDRDPQRNYCGDEFVQGDAVAFLIGCVARGNRLPDGRPIAAYHVSPPCQKFSPMSACRPGLADTYPDLIASLRVVLRASGLPYVIENVPGSPLRDPVVLCGQMFGLDLYRHRLFETNWPLCASAQLAPVPRRDRECGWWHRIPASKAGHWKPGTVMSVSGHVSPMWKAREAMGFIDWMNRDELAESIPPHYAQYVGEQLLEHLASERAA